jgi:flagellar basal-body rod modification protein FlgD
MPISSSSLTPTPVATVLGAGGSTPATAVRPDTLGKDAFLKLLVAQLRYQDPTNPTDSAQFMSQTAQFTQVEKLDEIAKSVSEMLAAQSMFATSSLVGRTVTYTGSDGAEMSGVVTSASFGPAGALLRVGATGTEIPVSAVKEIRQDVSTPPAPVS